MPLTVILNGESRTLDSLTAGANVKAFLEVLGVKSDRVALEVNGSITPRSSWSSFELVDHDEVEMVHFVGGGAIR